MAIWLQRQEAMWIREGFITWLEGGISTTITEDPEDDGVDDCNIDYHGHTSPGNAINYSLAKKAPFQNINVSTLSSSFGAFNFLPALTTFLRLHLPICNIAPSHHDRFNAFQQLNVKLPANCYLNDNPQTSRICTTPTIEAKGHTPAKPAHFNVALIIEDHDVYKRFGGIAGLRVAQVRVIFKLPPQFRYYLHPLAYVEWFTSLGNPDPLMGMHTVTRSMCQSHRNVLIVPVTQITPPPLQQALSLQEIWLAHVNMTKTAMKFING
ncbi:hypothetical protein BYT27DRAFT_7264414 [Phlegmacium glaucopus]|nr:hypothetical protein BYT27DRAFT_7264414 [Phlegmacium glaucopus]